MGLDISLFKMKPTGRINPMTGNEIFETEFSDINFWEIPWNKLSDIQKCDYLSFRHILFLSDLNRDVVEALYLSDQLKNICTLK